jgi:hypothetical protein
MKSTSGNDGSYNLTVSFTHQSVIKTTFLLYKAVVSAMAGV